MPEDWIGIVRDKKGANRLPGAHREDMTDRGLPGPDMSDTSQSEGIAEANDHQDEPGDGILNAGVGDKVLIGEGGADQPDTDPTNDDVDFLSGQAVNPADLTEFDLSVDTLVFVKDLGAPDPMLRLTINRDRTQTLTADDEIVAVIDDIDMCVSDIVIVERGAIGIAG